MITGIEAAGLALAIFPIVVQSVDFYLTSARKIKDMKDQERTLGRLVMDLKVECWGFESACVQLLEGLVSAEQMVLCMKGIGWDDPHLEQRLQNCWGLEFADTFTLLVKELFMSLERLMNDLGIADKKVEKLSKRTWAKMKLVLKKEEALADISKTVGQLERLAGPRSASFPKTSRRDQAIKHELYNRVRSHAISLHATLSEKLGDHSTCHCAEPHNANLRLDSIETITSNTSDIAEGEPRFGILFSFDKRLPQWLLSGSPPWIWREIEFLPINVQMLPNPAISDSHLVSEGQEIPDRRSSVSPLPAGEPVVSRKKDSGNRRRDILLLPLRRIRRAISSVSKRHLKTGVCEEKAIEESPLKKSASATGLVGPTLQSPRRPFDRDLSQEIRDLCSTIASMDGETTNVGILGSENIWRLRTTNASYCSELSAEAVSLDTLLSLGSLQRPETLRIGAQLASSLLQLHATGWLPESWGKGDIYFPQVIGKAQTINGKVTSILHPVLNKPLIRRSFKHPRAIVQPQVPVCATKKSRFSLTNKSLFSLGIILIELWLGRRLEDLPEFASAPNSDHDYDTDDTECHVANQLIPRIIKEAGSMYGGAVRRCIRGLDYTATSLEDDGFKNEVHSKVIAELERSWKAYNGELPITLTRPNRSVIQQQKTPVSTLGLTFYRAPLERFDR